MSEGMTNLSVVIILLVSLSVFVGAWLALFKISELIVVIHKHRYEAEDETN